MEEDVVVVASLSEGGEVLAGLWSVIMVELYYYCALLIVSMHNGVNR